jgi:hypothetical protein
MVVVMSLSRLSVSKFLCLWTTSAKRVEFQLRPLDQETTATLQLDSKSENPEMPTQLSYSARSCGCEAACYP